MAGRAPNELELILSGRKDPSSIPLYLLQSITHNFSSELVIGHGGFGVVYKGLLPDGTTVAVKKAVTKPAQDYQFRREVQNLLTVKHKNIVWFLGYCSNSEAVFDTIDGKFVQYQKWERLLCFEYLSNGSLKKYISGELRGLQWQMRYQIIKGICEGLRYLHEEKRIIHRDLKPENILLDDLMVPKIADLGISKLLDDGASKAITTDRNTSMWYCSPEFHASGQLTYKFDIYSLGVIIIELITGHPGNPDAKNVLRRWRYRWNKSSEVTPSPFYDQQVARCIDIGLLCKERDPKKRPTVSQIIGYFNEMDSLNGEFCNFYESTVGQIVLDWKDLLRIEPLELYLPFEENKQISCSVQLSNDTDDYIAFNIETSKQLEKYTQPTKGIVLPKSTFSVEITLPAQEKSPLDMQDVDEFTVQSTKVKDGFRPENVTKSMFRKGTNEVVDEVNMEVVCDAPPLPEEPKGDLSVKLTAEAVSKNELVDAHQNEEYDLLNVHPLRLCFPLFEPNKSISSVLRLSNNTDEGVAFRILPKVPESFMDGLSGLNGIVPPRSTRTYLVCMEKQPPVNMDEFAMTLETCIAHADVEDLNDHFLPEVIELTQGNRVHEVALMAAINSDRRGLTNKVICRVDPGVELTEIDVHPIEPWILTSHRGGGIAIWNYVTQERVMALETLGNTDEFRSAKFIARKDWFLAGDWDGSIHVCSCVVTNIGKVKKTFKAHDAVVISLAVHPTEPLLLSASGDSYIKLWNWEANWKCIRRWKAHIGHTERVMFNPVDTNYFASVGGSDCTVKIWKTSSPLPITLLDCHQQRQLTVDYFHPGGDRQYMVTGSPSGNARIWDLKTNTCIRQIHELENTGNSRNAGVLDCFPDRQLLLTTLKGNIVSVYNFNTNGYENAIDFNLGTVCNFAYIKGIKSVAIGFIGGIAIMEIN